MRTLLWGQKIEVVMDKPLVEHVLVGVLDVFGHVIVLSKHLPSQNNAELSPRRAIILGAQINQQNGIVAIETRPFF